MHWCLSTSRDSGWFILGGRSWQHHHFSFERGHALVKCRASLSDVCSTHQMIYQAVNGRDALAGSFLCDWNYLPFPSVRAHKRSPMLIKFLCVISDTCPQLQLCLALAVIHMYFFLYCFFVCFCVYFWENVKLEGNPLMDMHQWQHWTLGSII